MTGYANGDRTTAWGLLSCEIRSVNSRHLELFIRAPDDIRAFEPAIRNAVQQQVQRGKIEIGLRLKREEGVGGSINAEALQRYSLIARELEGQFPGLTTDFARLLTLPGVMHMQDIDQEGLGAEVLGLLADTLQEFTRAREREGAKLEQVIRQRIDGIETIAGQARDWIPQIREAQRIRLLSRLEDIAQSADPSRIEQEMVIALTKLDVDEELDRLNSHITEARRILDLNEAVGRRMDFLMQEFNREANTLGSKSVDSRTGAAAVELKVLIDQVREQIQNIE